MHDLVHRPPRFASERRAVADPVDRRRDRVLDLLAALDERFARLRTSLATTAKLRPCSRARAVSTAAFSASMLV
ncbi:hypothetical protein OKW29_007420 [Paraburkholderia sp. CI3]